MSHSTESQATDVELHKPRKSVLGLVVKYILLGLIDSIGGYAVFLMVAASLWIPAVVLVASLIGINWLYLTERAVPLKYLLPGTVTMAVFAVLPIVYTVYIAFTNYSTGHVLSKEEAIAAISNEGYTDYDAFTVQVADDSSGKRVYLLERFNAEGSAVASYVGDEAGLTEVTERYVLNEANQYEPIPPAGYTAVDSAEVDKWLSSGKAFRVPLTDIRYIQLDTANLAYEREQRWVYDKKADTFTDTSCGNVFKDNGHGNFVGKECEFNEPFSLEKGWMVGVGFENFLKVFNNPRYSEPMARVFIWTVVYAGSSVFLTFTIGMLVAFLFNVPTMRGRKLYRGLLIIPYAVPGFLSLLVWRGLLNPDWGAVNTLLGLEIPWLTDPTWAKVSILLVNTWLGFPYMFLVATGALQAIPAELKEAASVDGANRMQIFRNVTLPLLLVAVGPLLVGSFSYNFNNFNQVYLLTGGGPEIANQNTAAGATDILISYTYKLAFFSGAGNNYGLASAVSIMLFFIVGGMAFWSFRRSKALENMS